jgi:tetratricopeptide (TPR) repeat protein
MAYTAQGDILFALDQPAEAMVSFDKVVAVAEEYLRSRPEDEGALLMMSRAYNNTALHADPRLSENAATERSIELLRGGLTTDEKLLALHPDSEDYQRRLASARQNLARWLAVTGHHPEALQLFQLAAQTAAHLAEDPNDGQAQYFSALIHSALAGELLAAGKIDEARVILLRCAEVLQRLVESGNTLRIEYAFGNNAVRLGQLYTTLATGRAVGSDRRATYWRQSRDYFEQGVASLHKVTSAVAIERIDQRAVTEGVAGLARAEAELAKLTG